MQLLIDNYLQLHYIFLAGCKIPAWYEKNKKTAIYCHYGRKFANKTQKSAFFY